MKKKYITPAIGPKCMESCSILSASVTNTNDAQAAEGSQGNGVNFSRQGSFWDDSE